MNVNRSPKVTMDGSSLTPGIIKTQPWRDQGGVRPPVGGVATMLTTTHAAVTTPDPKHRRVDLIRMSAMSEQSTENMSALSQSLVEMREDSVSEHIGSWEPDQRPSSESSLSSSSSEERLNVSSPRTFWERRSKLKAVSGAPDLVMDLPVSTLSSSPKESTGSHTSPRLLTTMHCDSFDSASSGGSTPGTQSPDMTAAECFAKQSQSTLKKTPAIKTFSSHSTDAQTQTHVPMKIGGHISLEMAQRSHSTELKICEGDESSVSSIVRSLDDVMQQLDSEMKTDRTDRPQEVQTEAKTTTEQLSVEVEDSAIPPSTPKLAARYLQAVAAAQGNTPTSVKPAIRVKPTVLKKPSLPRASPEPEPSK